MKLIEFMDDIFVASEVVAIQRTGKAVEVHLRTKDSSFQYEYDSESEAFSAFAAAAERLQHD